MRNTGKSTIIKDWFSYFAPKFICFTVTVGFLTRIALLFIPPTVIDFTFGEWLKIFGRGVINDIAFAVLALAPAMIVHATLNDSKYRKPFGYILFGLLLALAVYSFSPGNIFSEYGKALNSAMRILSSLLLCSFAIRLFVPSIRKGWCRTGLLFLMGLYVFLMVLNALSECVFWFEFGVRYNFIAVDYLVYTNEVFGNIMESYPIIPMFFVVLLIAVAISWKMFRGKDFSEAGNNGLTFFKTFAVYAIVFCCSFWWLHYSYREHNIGNNYANELQRNGCWNFLEAYNSSTLEYDRFYEMLPENEARNAKQRFCGQDSDGVQAIRDSLAPIKKNIVLIAVESLSADFLTEYGNKDGITPNLDTLIGKSLVFDRYYAAGNRSVRGLEAMTLCIPPSAGESLIKRPDNGGLFSTATVLKEMGYTSTFYYGGESYFDNMKTYFSGNGFDIVDKSSFKPEEITFSNIWGTCDEDTYRVALRCMDEKAQAGELFHSIIFTISNHRPYTFPEGRITLDGEMKSRAGAVKYTDYAIGQFLKEASGRPWFSETIFIITADHCASSAGKTTVPVDRYHIPVIIYAPGFIEPRRIDKVCSQIDLMPTVFSLLHFSYDSKFYGQDILAEDYFQRAFMATYQDLGYLRNDVLTLLSPVKRIQQFDVEETAPGVHKEVLRESIDETLAKEAQTFYQNVNLGY